jgi:glycosyltransferase involved in cell wall biosynthesis
MRRLRMLLSAYACEPGLGSEAGIGWHCVNAVAEHADVVVLTRESNRKAIEDAGHTGSSLTFIYYDLPRWLRVWKRGPRGARLYYVLWQFGIYFRARKVLRQQNIDAIHHVTFGALWMPTLLFLLPRPFVWGPVGGGEALPPGYARTMSLRGRVYEAARRVLRLVTLMNPLSRAVARRAVLSLATTEQSAAVLHSLGAREVRVLSHVGFSDGELLEYRSTCVPPSRPFRICSAGRLIEWKGIHLGLRAFALFLAEVPDAEYIVIGEGPSRKRLERMAQLLRIEHAVRFEGQLSRVDTIRAIGTCHILLHPSLHDSGGYVCAEALAVSCPVVCLDVGGPPLVVGQEGGLIVPSAPHQSITRRLASAFVGLARENANYQSLREAAQLRATGALRWSTKGAYLAGCYEEVVRGTAALECFPQVESAA